MKAASIHEIKKELESRDSKEILEYCLRLVKFKKENKELLTYLLFQTGDMAAYISGIKNEIDQQFSQVNTSNIYFIKKSVRKILRNLIKQIKYAASPQTEAELLIHFCNSMITHAIPIKKSAQLLNIYNNQLKKIDKCLSNLHPDLQYDLNRQLIK